MVAPDHASHVAHTVNSWERIGHEDYVAIEDLESLPPFFLSIVGPGNQWMFLSSHGAPSAGRQSPDQALFPYYTVDKIIDNWNSTGPWTAISCDGLIWQPFLPRLEHRDQVTRRLLKSVSGDTVRFEEHHHGLQLTVFYSWRFSGEFGFVRRAGLQNHRSEIRSLRVVDGLDNILPPGIDSRTQLHYSCLGDAYKVSELAATNRLLIHRLNSGITDEPIPLASLLATTVWHHGLGDGPTFLSRDDASSYLRGDEVAPTRMLRARRGAFFLGRDLEIDGQSTKEWMMVADVGQSQSDVSRLVDSLDDPDELLKSLSEDLENNRCELRRIVASADGIQDSGDRDNTLHHYQNTLCNIMRGGVPESGYQIRRDDFIRHLEIHHRSLAVSHRAMLDGLPGTLLRNQLLDALIESGDRDLIRIATEYVPLILSRRHGDPSRPWNRFDIRVADDQGRPLHHFEGNWRDIFQNWEALALSYPDFLDSFITKFLNASTIDGFNPYRITSNGVDWEVPDEDDPWASIGYWGDHQIVYLARLLDLQFHIAPASLTTGLNTPSHVFADVPYRLRNWNDTLTDPRDTVSFDAALHKELMERKERIGADGLLRKADGVDEPLRATLAEKLLIPALVKLANLVPGGGIWMNTQRPEWNDANNALAGCGLSVVTTSHLLHYFQLLNRLLDKAGNEELDLSPAVARLLSTLRKHFHDPRWENPEALSNVDRFELTERSGRALESYRDAVYQPLPQGSPHRRPVEEIVDLLQVASAALEACLRSNAREDGLWHSYNVLEINRDTESMSIRRLPLMLEGQVAILDSGLLTAGQSVHLLEALRHSPLRSERHRTYLLYPDKPTAGFLETNRVSPAAIQAIPSLAALAEAGDERILQRDPDGDFRFHPSLINHYALGDLLDQLSKEPASSLQADRSAIESLYEDTFQHHLFTGRSGSMFGYEGLGCVYWHMVSKLLLAVQRVTTRAMEDGSPNETISKLIDAFLDTQSGLGYRKTPRDYGAFPAEPYSHSPGHAGAKQPGLTGQAKEGILCRFGELGVRFENGCLSFRPRLLRSAEFQSQAPTHPGRNGSTPEGNWIDFTVAGTPVHYRADPDLHEPTARVHYKDGRTEEVPDGKLEPSVTRLVTGRSGAIQSIEVRIPSQSLIS